MAAAPPLLPRQDTQALPLAPSVRARLLAAGYRTVADLEGVGEGELERGKNKKRERTRRHTARSAHALSSSPAPRPSRRASSFSSLSSKQPPP